MCSASGVDGWSLDILYLVPLIQLDGEGTKKWQGESAEGQLYMDPFPLYAKRWAK